MGEYEEITPYRMGILINLASKVSNQMIQGAWHLTYPEMEIVLKLIQLGIDESRAQNEKIREEKQECS